MHPPHPSARPAVGLSIQNLCVRLGSLDVLTGVDAVIPAGEMTAIIGPNGAGKTTLLNALLGFHPCTGSIQRIGIDGQPLGRHDPARSSLRIGFVPQRLELQRQIPLRAVELLATAVQHAPLWIGVGPRARARAAECLQSVGALSLLNRRIGELSGGEIQRVLLARALMPPTLDLLLLDEPAAAVDAAGGQLFCDLLEQVRATRGCTVVLVSHDLSVVTRHARHVICLNQRVLCEGSPTTILTGQSLEQLYGARIGLYTHHHGCTTEHRA